MKYTVGTLPLVMILLSACGSEAPTPPPVKKEVTQTVEKKAPPPPPKKDIKLKEVEDTNYSSAYMYPEDSVKKEPVGVPLQTVLDTATGMNKEECIAMISQEKFDKYSAMFGSETASIKRCNMINAMNQ